MGYPNKDYLQHEKVENCHKYWQISQRKKHKRESDRVLKNSVQALFFTIFILIN